MNLLIKRNERLLFGLELEVEGQAPTSVFSTSQIQQDIGVNWRIKHDGSLRNGIEIVSIPFSFDYYIINKDKFIKTFNTIKRHGLVSFCSERCGGHIHMTLTMGPLHIYKFIAFINRNRPFVEFISQRKQSKGYAKFVEGRRRFIIQAKTRNSSFRYQAVRIDAYKNTIECRCFKGTLSSAGIFKNIEFMYALYTFTLNASLRRCGLKSFQKFLENNKNTYPHLHKFITSERYRKESGIEKEEIENGGISLCA